MDEIKVKQKPEENFVHWEKKCFRTVYEENIIVLERGIKDKSIDVFIFINVCHLRRSLRKCKAPMFFCLSAPESLSFGLQNNSKCPANNYDVFVILKYFLMILFAILSF